MKLSESEVVAALTRIEDGLQRYCWIQTNVGKCNAESDREFQKRFNGFYRIRRNSAWQQVYYRLLERSKREPIGFPEALRTLKEHTNRIEASFASKLVATIRPTAPVVDRYVLAHFGLRLPYSSASNRMARTIAVYDKLCQRYEVFMSSPEGQMICARFRERYPWAHITNLKMIDLVLWQLRP